MDWLKILQEAIPILVPLGGFTLFLWNGLKGKFDKIDQRFEKIDQRFEKIDQKFEKIDEKLEVIKSNISALDRRVQRIEDRLEYSNKVVYVQHEDIKEN